MAWLARLDARAKRAPRVIYWPYFALKWTLVGLGVYGVIGLAIIEIQERRVGLGTGVCSTVLITLVTRNWEYWRQLTGRGPRGER